MPGRVYTQLFEVAVERHGYLTPGDARGLGVDPLRLQDLVRRGLADHVSHGVYRLRLVPVGPLDQYMEAVLWPQAGGGVICGQSALDLHGLCDVSPAKVHVCVPARCRPRRPVPEVYALHRRDLDEGAAMVLEGIPIVTPLQAIEEGIEEHLPGRLVEQAIETAGGRGLVTERQLEGLRGRLGVHAV